MVMTMRHLLNICEDFNQQAVLSQTFYHGTSTLKPKSKEGLYVGNDEGWALYYADNMAEEDVYGGNPLILIGTVTATRPFITDDDTIEQIGYDANHIAELQKQGFDCALRTDGVEVFLFTHKDFRVAQRKILAAQVETEVYWYKPDSDIKGSFEIMARDQIEAENSVREMLLHRRPSDYNELIIKVGGKHISHK